MAIYRTIIVDSDTIFTENLIRAFKSAPQLKVIATCANGVEALRLVEKETPDLVLTEILLPGMDGISLLRAMETLRNPPVTICISEFFSKTILESARLHKAEHFLAKPINFQSVAEIILECAELSFKKRQQHEGTEDAVVSGKEMRQIMELLRELGFSPRYVGSRYLAEAILILKRSPMLMHNLSVGLYKEVAGLMHTSVSGVERSIRTAISAANESSALTEKIGCSPTNTACLRYLSGRIAK